MFSFNTLWAFILQRKHRRHRSLQWLEIKNQSKTSVRAERWGRRISLLAWNSFLWQPQNSFANLKCCSDVTSSMQSALMSNCPGKLILPPSRYLNTLQTMRNFNRDMSSLSKQEVFWEESNRIKAERMNIMWRQQDSVFRYLETLETRISWRAEKGNWSKLQLG